ncbi:MAG: hypothetical protein RLZZ24_1254 [Pseudomonadota bacterium]
MRKSFKFLFYLIVLIGFSVVHAGVYEDFFRSIHANDVDSVRYLVEERGVDPNWPNEKGQPALTLSLLIESHAVASYLARLPQTRTETPNLASETALMLAALTNRMDVAQALIDKGAEINRQGWSALHYAATNGHVQMMRLLLDNNAYLDAEAPNGNTPLMMAVQFGSPMAVKLLLEEGADPNVQTNFGQTAMDLAQMRNDPMMIHFIQAFLAAWKHNEAADALR